MTYCIVFCITVMYFVDLYRFFLFIPGGPKKRNGRYSRFFRTLLLINSYLFSPCWIEHLFLIIITPRSSNLVEKCLFYE